MSAKRRAGVQSVETGIALLRALGAAGESQALTALAAQAGMAPAKAHRYLASFIEAGMVVQDEASRYDLGPAALEIGLAALARSDAVRNAVAELRRLRDQIDETVSLLVWGAGGPVVVRTEMSRHEVALTMRIGTNLAAAASATGRLFLAFAPADAAHVRLTRAQQAAVRDARARGLARVKGDVLSGVSAIAAPLFDLDGHIVAAVVAYGRSQTFDGAWDGVVARAVRAFAARLSPGAASGP